MLTGTVVKSSAQKAMTSVAAYEGVEKMWAQARNLWRNKFAYTVTISERDLLYDDVHNWLLTIMPDERHRSLLVSTSIGARRDELEDVSAENTSHTLVVRYNSSRPRTVMVDGYRVSVIILKPEEEKSLHAEPAPQKIEFSARTYEAQQAVIEHLHRINNNRSTSRKAVLRMVNQWGSWRTRSDLPTRSLDSVSIPWDQKKRIVRDLDEFLKSEDKYNRLAISWHRGYMLKGPSGTGKTSLVKALANEFNLDLWYISLSDLKAESSLLGLLAEVGSRSILLLEDIDTIKITHDRDSSEQGTISMSSLLNTLDGVATPHGLITMMTTNRFEMLDDALTRAGRMDLIEEIGWPTIKTLSDMYYHFFDSFPNWVKWPWDEGHDIPIVGLSPAKVAEMFKHHMNDPEGASVNAAGLINSYSDCLP